jgi:hypothetical protein
VLPAGPLLPTLHSGLPVQASLGEVAGPWLTVDPSLFVLFQFLVRFLALSVFLLSSSSCFLTSSEGRFPFISIQIALRPFLFACYFNTTWFALRPFFRSSFLLNLDSK